MASKVEIEDAILEIRKVGNNQILLFHCMLLSYANESIKFE